MNKKFFIAALFGLAIAASCQKEQLREQEERPVEQVEFSAMTEAGSVSTKLSLGVGLKPEWKDADEIAVYDQSKIQQFFVFESEGSQAKFTGKVTEGAAEFSAVYPYSAAKSFADGKFTVEIPAEQVIEAGDSADASALLAVAQASKTEDGVHLSFKNVCGLIQVKIPQSGKICAVVIKGKGEEAIAGEGVVTISDTPSIALAATASKTVTLRPAGENATFDAGTYYAAVAPVKFAAGFTVSLVRTDGAAGLVGTDLEMEVVRNGGKGLDDIVSISDWSWIIYTKEQLLAWNKGDRKNTDYVELGADIDMQGETWVPHAFSGTFDGKGHKIYNFVVDTSSEEYKDVERKYASFITDCSGKLMNLIIGSKDGETYDGVSEFLLNPLEDDANWEYVGVVGKISGSAGIENVTNFSKLTIAEGTASIRFAVGGIAAMINGKSPIKNCVNNGDIAVLNTGTPKSTTCVIGGITGKFDYEGSITDCVNNGDILNKNTGVWAVGGIVGNTNAIPTNMAPVITNADNNGKITMNGGQGVLIAGGIAGALRGGILDGCDNNGVFELGYNAQLYYGGVAGRFYNEMKNGEDALILTKSTEVKNCSNKDGGTFSWTATEGTKDVRVGGILGNSEGGGTASLTLSGCKNYADIEISHPRIRAFGGIGGGISLQTCKLTVEDCHNYGHLTVSSKISTLANNTNYAGIIGLLYGSTSGTLVKNCSNSGDVVTKMPTAQEHLNAGIVANLQKNAEIIECTNNGKIENPLNVSAKSRIGGIVAISQSLATGGSFKISSCVNKGDVITRNIQLDKSLGGIVGYVKVNTTISDCANEGDILCLSDIGGASHVGGITGFSASAIGVQKCSSSGNIKYESITTGTGTAYVAGICALCSSANVSLSENINSSDITVNYTGGAKKPIMTGGIASVMDKTGEIISKCENKGKVTLNYTGTHYICAGGILSRSVSVTLDNNINHATGAVTINASTSNQLCAAGGIIGDPNGNVVITNNTNYAPVSTINTHATPYAYAGGIFGSDCEGTLHASGKGAKSVSGNVNYGSIYAKTQNTAMVNSTYAGASAVGSAIGAGGLFGITAQSTGIADDNKNFGSVSADNGGVPGGAGAAAGVSNTASAWGCVIGKGVTVNGTPWSEDVQAAWLCPVSTMKITPSYVDQPVNE